MGSTDESFSYNDGACADRDLDMSDSDESSVASLRTRLRNNFLIDTSAFEDLGLSETEGHQMHVVGNRGEDSEVIDSPDSNDCGSSLSFEASDTDRSSEGSLRTRYRNRIPVDSLGVENPESSEIEISETDAGGIRDDDMEVFDSQSSDVSRVSFARPGMTPITRDRNRICTDSTRVENPESLEIELPVNSLGGENPESLKIELPDTDARGIRDDDIEVCDSQSSDVSRVSFARPGMTSSSMNNLDADSNLSFSAVSQTRWLDAELQRVVLGRSFLHDESYVPVNVSTVAHAELSDSVFSQRCGTGIGSDDNSYYDSAPFMRPGMTNRSMDDIDEGSNEDFLSGSPTRSPPLSNSSVPASTDSGLSSDSESEEEEREESELEEDPIVTSTENLSHLPECVERKESESEEDAIFATAENLSHLPECVEVDLDYIRKNLVVTFDIDSCTSIQSSLESLLDMFGDNLQEMSIPVTLPFKAPLSARFVFEKPNAFEFFKSASGGQVKRAPARSMLGLKLGQITTQMPASQWFLNMIFLDPGRTIYKTSSFFSAEERKLLVCIVNKTLSSCIDGSDDMSITNANNFRRSQWFLSDYPEDNQTSLYVIKRNSFNREMSLQFAQKLEFHLENCSGVPESTSRSLKEFGSLIKNNTFFYASLAGVKVTNPIGDEVVFHNLCEHLDGSMAVNDEISEAFQAKLCESNIELRVNEYLSKVFCSEVREDIDSNMFLDVGCNIQSKDRKHSVLLNRERSVMRVEEYLNDNATSGFRESTSARRLSTRLRGGYDTASESEGENPGDDHHSDQLGDIDDDSKVEEHEKSEYDSSTSTEEEWVKEHKDGTTHNSEAVDDLGQATENWDRHRLRVYSWTILLDGSIGTLHSGNPGVSYDNAYEEERLYLKMPTHGCCSIQMYVNGQLQTKQKLLGFPQDNLEGMTCTMDLLLNTGLSTDDTYNGSYLRLKLQCKYLRSVLETIDRQKNIGYSTRLEWILALDRNTRLGVAKLGFPDILNCIEVFDTSEIVNCYYDRTKALAGPITKLVDSLDGRKVEDCQVLLKDLPSSHKRFFISASNSLEHEFTDKVSKDKYPSMLRQKDDTSCVVGELWREDPGIDNLFEIPFGISAGGLQNYGTSPANYELLKRWYLRSVSDRLIPRKYKLNHWVRETKYQFNRKRKDVKFNDTHSAALVHGLIQNQLNLMEENLQSVDISRAVIKGYLEECFTQIVYCYYHDYFLMMKEKLDVRGLDFHQLDAFSTLNEFIGASTENTQAKLKVTNGVIERDVLNWFHENKKQMRRVKSIVTYGDIIKCMFSQEKVNVNQMKTARSSYGWRRLSSFHIYHMFLSKVQVLSTGFGNMQENIKTLFESENLQHELVDALYNAKYGYIFYQKGRTFRGSKFLMCRLPEKEMLLTGSNNVESITPAVDERVDDIFESCFEQNVYGSLSSFLLLLVRVQEETKEIAGLVSFNFLLRGVSCSYPLKQLFVSFAKFVTMMKRANRCWKKIHESYNYMDGLIEGNDVAVENMTQDAEILHDKTLLQNHRQRPSTYFRFNPNPLRYSFIQKLKVGFLTNGITREMVDSLFSFRKYVTEGMLLEPPLSEDDARTYLSNTILHPYKLGGESEEESTDDVLSQEVANIFHFIPDEWPNKEFANKDFFEELFPAIGMTGANDMTGLLLLAAFVQEKANTIHGKEAMNYQLFGETISYRLKDLFLSYGKFRTIMMKANRYWKSLFPGVRFCPFTKCLIYEVVEIGSAEDILERSRIIFPDFREDSGSYTWSEEEDTRSEEEKEEDQCRVKHHRRPSTYFHLDPSILRKKKMSELAKRYPKRCMQLGATKSWIDALFSLRKDTTELLKLGNVREEQKNSIRDTYENKLQNQASNNQSEEQLPRGSPTANIDEVQELPRNVLTLTSPLCSRRVREGRRPVITIYDSDSDSSSENPHVPLRTETERNKIRLIIELDDSD